MATQTRMSLPQLRAFLTDTFPQVADQFVIEHVAPMSLSLRMRVRAGHLRPGGTVSGPAMFGLADVAVYLATLAMVGPEALAVTTNASIDFMRKPDADRDLIARAQLLKLGRSLSVGDVRIHSEGRDDPVARATLTYSLPPKPRP